MNTPTRSAYTMPTADVSREQSLVDAVTVLTAAARTGSDFAEFLTHAVAGTAANLGGIEELLAGRPGSWEAHYVSCSPPPSATTSNTCTATAPNH